MIDFVDYWWNGRRNIDNNPEGSTAPTAAAGMMGMGTAAVHETTTLFQWRHDFFYMGNWNQK